MSRFFPLFPCRVSRVQTCRTVALSFVLLAATAFFLSVPAAFSAPPRIAVWDPVNGTEEPRLHLELDAVTRIVGWLGDSGAAVSRVTALQVTDSAVFSAARYDAIFFIGNAFPRADLEALKRFADDGGVPVSLGAEVPFLIMVEADAAGKWKLSPSEPKFAWETSALLKHLGLRYVFDPKLHDQGVVHAATPLLKRYLPDATDLRGRRPSRWVAPVTDQEQPGEIYPLLHSQRRDGADVPPQIYLVRCGKRAAIVSTDEMYTSASRPGAWPLAKPTVAAFAALARDLHNGTLALTPDQAVTLRSDLSPLSPMPLERLATGSIEPEHALAVVRWGRFDGSGLELGPAFSVGQVAKLPAGAGTAVFPSVLEAGASVQLALPPLGKGPLFLRVRGAFKATDAALKVTLGETVVLNEIFTYIDTSVPGNFSRSLSGMADEFTRIVYLPPAEGVGAALTLSNPGREPLYFDAVQIERRTAPARQRLIGLGAGATGGGNHYPPELAKGWSGIRMSIRSNFLGAPGDPERFAKMDEQFNQVAGRNPRVEPILEGTPPWAAISPERLEEAKQAKRPTTVPPDPVKYVKIVEDLVARYGDRISCYEIWNEPDITQFYRGSTEEYITLFKTIVPIIRRLDPTAAVMTAGMAGYHEEFLRKLTESGVFKMADRIAFHPYAGKSAAWDLPYGIVEGCLISQGVDTEMYCNESGFPWNNTEWFKPPPQLTLQTQREYLDIAMARLLSMGLAKLSVFNAGGDENPYGLFDGAGKPRPAYAVFADYARLGQNDARRLDISMTGADGAPLQGVYAAASSHADGSATIVLNPAECKVLRPPDNPVMDVGSAGNWTCFFGTVKTSAGKITVTPAPNQKYAGCYSSITINTDQFPFLDVETSGNGGEWELALKRTDGTVVAAVPRQAAGKVRVHYRELLQTGGIATFEVSFRVYRPTTIAAVRFGAATDALQTPFAPAPVPVRLCVPVTGTGPLRASTTVGGQEAVVPVQVRQVAGENWAELTVPLLARTVVRLLPQPSP